ncbi:hypothetical protein CF328_g3051 [Tilletia controversa]|nr:hypothetical protein CF328_g3051 [Tilletia controversa]
MKVSILSIIFFITVATPIMAAMNCGTPATAAVTTKSTVTRTPPATPPVEVPKLGAWLIVPAKPVLLSLSDS